MEATADAAELIADPSQLAFFGLAFAVAFVSFAGRVGRSHLRFALALWAGGVCSHLGWALLHLPGLVSAPSSILQPGAASVLFFPIGLLLLAPWREALQSLLPALFVVRLGCLPHTCCYSTPLDATPELAGLVALGVACRRWPRRTALIALSGLGALRVVCEPLRAPGPDPWLDPGAVGLAWIPLGLLAQRHVVSLARGASPGGPLTRAVSTLLWVQVSFLGCGVLVRDPALATLLAALAASALVLAQPPVCLRREGFARGFAGGLLAALTIAAIQPHAGPAVTAEPARLLSAGVLAPFFEESLYRGRLLPALRPTLGRAGAVVVSGAVGALAHLRLAWMPAPFALGLVTGALMLRTGSLGVAIGVHMGWNLVWLAASL